MEQETCRTRNSMPTACRDVCVLWSNMPRCVCAMEHHAEMCVLRKIMARCVCHASSTDSTVISRLWGTLLLKILFNNLTLDTKISSVSLYQSPTILRKHYYWPSFVLFITDTPVNIIYIHAFIFLCIFNSFFLACILPNGNRCTNYCG